MTTDWRKVMDSISSLIRDTEARMMTNGLIEPTYSENLEWEPVKGRIIYGQKPLVEHKIEVRSRYVVEIKDLEKNAHDAMDKKFGWIKDILEKKESPQVPLTN